MQRLTRWLRMSLILRELTIFLTVVRTLSFFCFSICQIQHKAKKIVINLDIKRFLIKKVLFILYITATFLINVRISTSVVKLYIIVFNRTPNLDDIQYRSRRCYRGILYRDKTPCHS